ncbi:unnamed protein product [Rotaria sordida]|uniref:Uncharacterized protein n=3 Tax=Rotaria sordida TaxID=392033 RepID=A0A815N2X5_9BILA|nr:unnamed protein product [Rotaria sordida]CAF1632797.1 unnamed protein product [Rotaria sordida]
MDVVVATSGIDKIVIFLLYNNATSTRVKLYSTGAQSLPSSIVVGDFNNDNCLDIAVANYGTHNIEIFFGYGNGTFFNSKVLSTGSSRPLFINVGDFNNDNQSDIIIANYDTDSVSIFLGYDNGSFQNQKSYFTGYDSSPRSLAVGDFNKDNHLDIAIANYGTNNIGILFGYSNGSFSSQQIYTTNQNSNPISIAIGDFNNDNNLDIVVANYGIGNVGVFLNYNNGTFTPQITYSIGTNSRLQHVTVGDINNDNALDIIIVDSNNDQIHVFPGYGNGTFATISTYDVVSGSRPFAAAVADFNNDNQSDIVVITHETNQLLLLVGCSIRPSARQRNYLVKPSAHSSTVAIADFNNDTQLDIVVNGYEGSGVRIMFDYNNGTFAKEMSYSTGNNSYPQHICVSDLNNDNRIDIVTANLGSDSVGVLLGYGDGNFTTVTTYSAGVGSGPRFIVVRDVDNDSHVDIISANTGSSSIGVFFGYGNGSFASVTTYSTGIGTFPHSIAVGDVNNDNQLDIVVSIMNPDGIVVFLAYSKRIFRIIMFYSTGYDSAPVSIALADFNSDNRLDIVVANSRANNMWVLFGIDNGTFGRQRTYSTGSESLPYFVAVADFNHDNQLDIAMTYFRNDKVVIFFGHGNGDFELVRTYFVGTGSHPYGFAIADFNNDKQLEIVVTLWGNGYVAILTEYYAADFAKQIMYLMGYAPQSYSLAAGDFNRDNRSDIVIANSGINTIEIRIGLGNSTFDTQIMYSISTGLFPRYVNTADIDNDNNLDIVTVNSGSDSVSVNLGYGNGSFKVSTLYSTGAGSHPCSVVFGDLNNDNRLDLIIANEGTDNIAVLIGYNYSTFHKQKAYKAIGNLGPREAVVGDFNNDSYPDVAVVFYTTNNIGIFLGDGNGSFNVFLNYSTTIGSTPYSLVVDDINKDGRLDVIVANYGTDNVGIFLGYGNGNFAGMMTFPTGIGSRPYSVAVADFNDDGRLDIVVINIGTNNIGFLYGYGNGSFSTILIYQTGDNYFPTAVRIGDFNNDNRIDIAVVNTNTNNIGILLGYGNGNFTKQVTYSTRRGTRPYWVAFGDFNNDYEIDMVTANHHDNSISIFLGQGNGSFGDVKTYPTGDGSMPMYVNVGDFNNDHKLDIIVVNYGTNQIVVHFGLGDGTFLWGDLYSTDIGSQPNTLAICDFNKDGRLDIVVSNPGSDTIGLFLGYDSKPFANVKLGPTGDGSQPHSVAIGDFNNDDILDIAVANYGNSNVGIFLGLGNAFFDNMLIYSTGVDSGPYFVAVEDLNNDNHSDIVVANFKTDNIAILLGYGNATFAPAATYSTGDRSHPCAVTIADFDNDNILDIAIANSGTSTVLLLYGNGNGTFGNEESYQLGYDYRPYSIAVTDLNQDGFMDIVIACYGTDNVEILLKMC